MFKKQKRTIEQYTYKRYQKQISSRVLGNIDRSSLYNSNRRIGWVAEIYIRDKEVVWIKPE